MKKFSAFLSLLLAAALSLSLTAAAAPVSAPISCYNASALVEDGDVFLPVRPLCESMGYTVTWQSQDGVKSVLVQKDGDRVLLDLTNQQIEDNGHRYYAQGTATQPAIRLTSGTTYLYAPLFDPLFAVSTTYDASENQVSVTPAPENALSITTEKTETQEQYLKLAIQYPQISGLKDSKVQDSINAVLKQAADSAVAEGRSNAKDMAQWIADGYTGGVTLCETYFDYEIKYNQNGLLSVVLSDYQYSGGAHGSTIQSSYTFDLTTGKDLSLADLMTPDSGYTAFINASIRKQIDSRVKTGGLYEFTPGFTDIGEDPPYYVSDEGLVFYFQQYEYFPYAAGIQEFTIPYADLTSMLKPAYRFFYTAPVALTLASAGTTALQVGEIGQISLDGNPSTGYSWHCTVSDESVLLPVSSASFPGGEDNTIVGAGVLYLMNYKALKAGTAKITCLYYRDWEGTSSAARTLNYYVTVS